MKQTKSSNRFNKMHAQQLHNELYSFERKLLGKKKLRRELEEQLKSLDEDIFNLTETIKTLKKTKDETDTK